MYLADVWLNGFLHELHDDHVQPSEEGLEVLQATLYHPVQSERNME